LLRSQESNTAEHRSDVVKIIAIFFCTDDHHQYLKRPRTILTKTTSSAATNVYVVFYEVLFIAPNFSIFLPEPRSGSSQLLATPRPAMDTAVVCCVCRKKHDNYHRRHRRHRMCHAHHHRPRYRLHHVHRSRQQQVHKLYAMLILFVERPSR